MSILAEIERDLRTFADPGTAVLVDTTSAIWEKNGQQLHLSFTSSGPGTYPDVTLNGTRMSYRAFLASEWVADLRGFADFIVKTAHRPSAYIETNGVLEDYDADTVQSGLATELIQVRATHDLPFLSTRVLLVKGEAGSGKTIALREATARQARAFRDGGADSLFFFVDAQGRALSRLEDAMAKDLQDLRSRFSYAAIAPLTRHRLVVPIIDGFDELLGSGGYDEAFASLAAFLATLDGQGAVVASARSTFFDYRNFYENATRFSGDGLFNYAVETLSVEPWGEPQIEKYFFDFGERSTKGGAQLLESLHEIETSMSPANRELLSKPFYVSKIAQLLVDEQELKSDEDLLDQLVDAFVEREHRKLLDKNNRPLLSKKGHHAFLTALAEEMWWQEDRRLDVGTVQALAELVTESFGLPPTAANAIVERVSSYAFLTSDSSAKRFLRFEHEVFYGYFLAHKLRDFIEREPADLRRFLGRSVAEPTLVEQAVRLIGQDVERCSRAVETICSVIRPSLSEVVARENAGTLIGAIAQSAGSFRPGTHIRYSVFRQTQFGRFSAEGLQFERCDFSDVDLTGVRLKNPKFIQSPLRNIVVDLDYTRLDGADPAIVDDVYGLIVRGEQPTLPHGRVFSPNETARVLQHLGVDIRLSPDEEVDGYSDDIQARVDTLDRFLKKMERRFYASEEDIAHFPFTRKSEWTDVRALLERHNLLERHYIEKSGPREPLVRLSVPPDVLRRGEKQSDPSLPTSVASFWREFLAT